MRRLLLAISCLFVVALSCSPGFDPPSKVEGLRILAVTADAPYAHPGQKVTMRMTVADGAHPTDPRGIQIVWLGGCIDPEGDQYFLCFQQFAEKLAPLLKGGGKGPLPPDVQPDFTGVANGTPDAHAFTFTVPDDIVSRRPPPGDGPHYGIEYVFYAACAGKLAPAPFTLLGSKVPEFPLQCLDADGNPQGPDSFVPGYTQIYAFEDGRTNVNPPTAAVTLDGLPLPTDPTLAPKVALCPVSDAERQKRGCARRGTGIGDCEQHDLGATIPDAAEVMPDESDERGGSLREVVWVSYFADAGDVDSSVKLVSDSRKGYQDDHGTSWTAPDHAGLVQIWAVTRDQRGGESVARGFVRVQ